MIKVTGLFEGNFVGLCVSLLCFVKHFRSSSAGKSRCLSAKLFFRQGFNWTALMALPLFSVRFPFKAGANLIWVRQIKFVLCSGAIGIGVIKMHQELEKRNLGNVSHSCGPRERQAGAIFHCRLSLPLVNQIQASKNEVQHVGCHGIFESVLSMEQAPSGISNTQKLPPCNFSESHINIQ